MMITSIALTMITLAALLKPGAVLIAWTLFSLLLFLGLAVGAWLLARYFRQSRRAGVQRRNR